MNDQGRNEGGGDYAQEHANHVVGAIESLDDYVRRNGIRYADEDENGMLILLLFLSVVL